MVLERCTNAVASPFGVTGALLIIYTKHDKSAVADPEFYLRGGVDLVNEGIKIIESVKG